LDSNTQNGRNKVSSNTNSLNEQVQNQGEKLNEVLPVKTNLNSSDVIQRKNENLVPQIKGLLNEK
jgi:hypothetical protein